MAHFVRKAAVLWMVVLPLTAENIVEVDIPSKGRRYAIDLDAPSIQHSLAAWGGAGEGIPDWLLPYPGATPDGGKVTPRLDRPGKAFSATYRTAGTPEEVHAYYDQLVRSRGFTVLRSGPGKLTRAMMLEATHRGESVYLTTSTFRGMVLVSVLYGTGDARGAPQKLRLEAVSYDDNAGLLLLRDRASGREFHLSREAIIGNGRAPAMDEEGWAPTAMPAWLVMYPGARITVAPRRTQRRPGEKAGLFWEGESATGVEEIFEFYKQVFANSGFEVTSSGIRKSGAAMLANIAAVSPDRRHAAEASISRLVPGLSPKSTIKLFYYTAAPR